MLAVYSHVVDFSQCTYGIIQHFQFFPNKVMGTQLPAAVTGSPRGVALKSFEEC